MRRALAGLLLGICLSGAESARAELADDVATLAQEWRRAGSVRVLPAHVLGRGQRRSVLLTPAETDGRSNGCVSVALIGATSATFVARVSSGDGALQVTADDLQRASVAGVVVLTYCGARKALLSSLEIEMRSPRAVVQTLVARGPVPARAVREVLLRRDPGAPAANESPGPVPRSAPLAVRTGAVERRERRRGAEDLSRRLLHSDDNGTGDFLLGLVAGCHELDLFGSGATGGESRAVDIDAQVSLPESGEVLASDRSDSADASTSFCLGSSTTVRVRFAGGAARSAVLMLQARWAIPRGLPGYWSPDTRARMAQALRQQRVQFPTTSPVYSSIGVSGVTALPVETEPGACYQVVAAVIQGSAASMALAASVTDHTSQNRSPDDDDQTALAFCAGAAERALIEVEAQGPGVVWLLAVWQTGRVGLGEDVR